MDDGPVVFKRTKAKGTQRTSSRANRPEDDVKVANELEEPTESPSTLANKLKKKARVKPQSRLSFGGEDEGGEVFQVKKSNLSRNIALSKVAAAGPPISLEQASITPRNAAPVYDAAYLAELKANTASRPLPTAEGEYQDMDVDMHNIPVSAVDPTDADETSIPSASSITAAKQRRERMRAAPAESEDYISLSLTKRDDVPQGPHPESRLMREDDELGEGDDEYSEYTAAQERIALGKKSRKKEAAQRREEMVDMIADADEVDEETAEWEAEQLRRGGQAEQPVLDAKPVYKPTPIPPATQIPTLGSAVGRLTQSLTTLTVSHSQSTASLAALAQERLAMDERERELRSAVEAAEAKHSWFTAFQEWMETVATFLDEKFPLVEKLEDEHASLVKERHGIIARRRRLDDEDDLAIFLGSPPRVMEAEPELDELGRASPSSNPSMLRPQRRAARKARRAERLQTRPRTVAASGEEEGCSTDDALAPNDTDDYVRALADLGDRARDVLADVRAPEFRDPVRGVAHWFGEWRARYQDMYTGAWGGLGAVGAWEFWARLEILGWEPLAQGARTLDTFGWYVALYEYSRPRPEGDAAADEEPELGPDGDLVSAMIATAVIPRVCKLLNGGMLDAYSAQDVRRLVDFAEQLEVSLERNHAKFQMFLEAATSAFQTAVAEFEGLVSAHLRHYQPRFDPEAFPARKRVLARLSKLLENVLRWRRYTSDTFGEGRLATRLVASCILPLAETGWEVGGEECLRKVSKVLPPELVPQAMKSRLV